MIERGCKTRRFTSFRVDRHRVRPLPALGLALLLGVIPWARGAQARRNDRQATRPDLPVLDRPSLSALVEAQRHAVLTCREGTHAPVERVIVRVSVVPRQARRGRPTLREANVRFEIRAPGGAEDFHRCLQGHLRQGFRRAQFFVTRPLRLRHTFRLPRRVYSPEEVQSQLRAQEERFLRCFSIVYSGGATMDLRLNPDGRFVLRGLSPLPETEEDPSRCLQAVISSLRINPAPRRPRDIVHALGRR